MNKFSEYDCPVGVFSLKIYIGGLKDSLFDDVLFEFPGKVDCFDLSTPLLPIAIQDPQAQQLNLLPPFTQPERISFSHPVLRSQGLPRNHLLPHHQTKITRSLHPHRSVEVRLYQEGNWRWLISKRR